MNKRRLTILRDALIDYAKNPGNLEFDLHGWAAVPEKYWINKGIWDFDFDFDAAIQRARRGKNFCGSTACALGLATTIPSFRRAGLKDPTCPQFGLELGFAAGMLFFEISYMDAEELFSPTTYRWEDRKNPLAVAEKITSLLETA